MRKVIRFFKRLFRRAERNLDTILADFQATIDDLGRHVDANLADVTKHAMAELTARDAKDAARAASAKADAIRLKMAALIQP